MAPKSDRKRKGREKVTMNATSAYYRIAVLFLALGFGFLHQWHVSTLFENDRHFSHLSDIEREMSFRTEMGMYYSYYKTIAESRSFFEGFLKVTRDNLTEYPNVVNAARKYNLFPEIVIGFLYHAGKSLGVTTSRQCWQIDRGYGLSTITSCEGLAVPIYFYLEIVWYCAAITGAVIFLYSTYLSDSVYGGTIAILSFFYNHNECTRVQWTPPLRESFTYPALLYQMYNVTVAIREYQEQKSKHRLTWREILLNRTYASILVATLCSLLCWQFSQFVFVTQLIALLILKWLKIISNDLYLKLALMHGISLTIIILGIKSNLLLCSLYCCLLVSSCCCIFLSSKLLRSIDSTKVSLLEMAGTIVCTKFTKSFLLGSEDDEHIFNILRSKLTNYKDFHTMLYTCSVQFDFLQYETYEAIVKTLVLPTAILSGILVLYYWYRHFKIVGYPNCIEADVAYNALQTGAFIAMAFLIMRLKLFMTPHLCLMAGLVTSKRYLNKLGITSENTRGAIIVLLLAGMSYCGFERLREERGFIGEYSNIEQEKLFKWIIENTSKTAVFAGKMSLMANLMLSTGRPIVNNPYYEDKEMRNRTLRVYEIFSRRDAASVYDTLKKMQVDYVILEEGLCLGYGHAPPGCQMVDLWDTTDGGEQEKAGKMPLCQILFLNPHPFRRVFMNRDFLVLKLDYSKYVELKPAGNMMYQF